MCIYANYCAQYVLNFIKHNHANTQVIGYKLQYKYYAVIK